MSVVGFVQTTVGVGCQGSMSSGLTFFRRSFQLCFFLTDSCLVDTGGEVGVGSSWVALLTLFAAEGECCEAVLSCLEDDWACPCADDEVRDESDGFARVGSEADR